MPSATDTLVNEAPMLTANLAFDLGDTLECDMRRYACAFEPVWICDQNCGCDKDIPSCDSCRVETTVWDRVYRVTCETCGAPGGFTNWRKI